MRNALIAEWDVLRLVLHEAEDGWHVYAFETDEPEANNRFVRGIVYRDLESARKAALETATELLGYGITASDLHWKPIAGPLP
jgi:hypothetical protein